MSAEAKLPSQSPRTVLWSAWAVSVSTVLVATFAVAATPHVRGIGFQPALRYAVVAPLCIGTAVMAAFLYRALAQRRSRASTTLAGLLLGLAAVVLLGLVIAGPRELAKAATPTVLAVAVATAWLVPRFVDRPRRSRVGLAAIVAFGALELVGIGAAWSSGGGQPLNAKTIAAEIPRSLFDAEHKFVNLSGGVRVHYVDEGQGATLVFLHGNPAWSFQWRELIHGLRGSYRCVALDYPGFGWSEAPAGFGFTPAEESRVVEEFVDRLGLHDFTLVMQDWGGPIGLGLAGRRPELVKRVILGNTWAWPTGASEPRGKFSKIAGGPIGEFIQVNFNGIPSLGLKNGVIRPLPADVAEAYTMPFRPLDRRGIAAFYPGQITAANDYFAEVEAGLARLREKPALIFWAMKDIGFPRSDLTRFQRMFPRNQTFEFANANHFFFEDEANAMIAAIRSFIPPEKPPQKR